MTLINSGYRLYQAVVTHPISVSLLVFLVGSAVFIAVMYYGNKD